MQIIPLCLCCNTFQLIVLPIVWVYFTMFEDVSENNSCYYVGVNYYEANMLTYNTVQSYVVTLTIYRPSTMINNDTGIT